MSELLLETRDLVKMFGDHAAVAGLNLEVHPGEMVGLVGPDGAGKTTAMRLIVGALHPTSGSIRVAGYDVPAQIEKAREHLGYLAQKFAMYGDLTIAENLEFYAEVFGITGEERIKRSRQLLTFAGLQKFENRPAAALSGGMQKKLGLATALIHQPKLLLLDEPTGGVDPVARQEFWHLLVGLLRGGSGVLVSTPYMDEATRFNRVVFMNKGKALLNGTPRELMAQLDGRILELSAQPQRLAHQVAQADPDVEDVNAFGDRLHLRARDANAVMNRLPGALVAAGVSMAHIRFVSPTLEDVFMNLLETK
ncbi:MAG TPA: ABC transporter ATP-binding protein [Thermoflexales bacterium]|nr:ABC transporter ATP-binding protein [Thermoflexales bacterium]